MHSALSHLTALSDVWLLIIGGGFCIGFLVGLTGVGAGALTTPLLISVVGLPPAIAVGTDLLFASLTKASAAWRHHKLANVDWPIMRWLAGGSLPGAIIMLAWLTLLRPDTHALALAIRKGLSVALVISAFAIALYPWLMRYRSEWAGAPDGEPQTARRTATVLFGLVLGMLVALTSVGAGSIGVTVLSALYPGLLARRIVGTDIVHAIPLTLVAGLGHAHLGNLDLGVLALLLAGSIPGIALGSRVTGLMPDWVLRLALALVLLNAAYLLLPKA